MRNETLHSDRCSTSRHRSLTHKLSCDADLPADVLSALQQADVDRLLFSSTPLQVKDRCVVARYDGADGSLLIKRHIWGSAFRTLRMAWRKPVARRCARLGLRLSELGIPTPRPRAYLEHRIGPFGYRSYLLTDFVEGTSLYRVLRFGEQESGILKRLADQVASIWDRLVQLGMCHGDMKPENFIVDNNLRVWLIDLEKMREGRITRRQRRRQIADVRNFLHVRAWHNRPQAREIFRRALMSTDAGKRLALDSLGVLAENASCNLSDADLSVIVLCDSTKRNVADIQPLVESVRDFADEVVLAAPAGSRLDVLKRIQLCDSSAKAQPAGMPGRRQPVARCEWVLVLHPEERVTPVLARKLQERIMECSDWDAFRVPIEQQFFGRSLALNTRSKSPPIRLFRQAQCSYSAANGELNIAIDPERVGELVGTIQKTVFSSVADFVAFHNEHTTGLAEQRLRAGHRPGWSRAVRCSTARFVKQWLMEYGIRSGRIGLHLAFLEAIFAWVEELKLWQLSGEFDFKSALQSASLLDDESAVYGIERLPPPLSASAAKAA